jgi:hypothetical protein
MKTNPILEELWKVKDDLAREAGHDPHRFFENLRQWAAEHPHPGPMVHSADELQQLIAEKERQRAAEPDMLLHDKPPRQP